MAAAFRECRRCRLSDDAAGDFHGARARVADETRGGERMRLAWHIALKDLRRAALPAGLWLAFLMAAMLWFRAGLPAAEGNLSAGITGWMSLMSIWTQLIVSVQLVIAYVLAGALALDDTPVGTDGFWMTRPLANGRLLTAKVMASVLLFVVAPIFVLTPLWLASG